MNRSLAPEKVSARHHQDVQSFERRATELGRSDALGLTWYHTIDLGFGLTTPGFYDYRSQIANFGFPEAMEGMTVLDVGAATGFFSFELERRGALVTAIELPSLEHLDRFPGQTVEQSLERIRGMHHASWDRVHRPPTSPKALYDAMLGWPFEVCSDLLESSVRRRFATIYELSEGTTGASGFDYVVLGDVLVHTLFPFRALAAAAELCTGTLVIAQNMAEIGVNVPAMVWVGGTDPLEDEISWWLPTEGCMVEVLRKLGFAQVRRVGSYSGTVRPSGNTFQRTILHASRR